jgi:hypothetical protein
VTGRAPSAAAACAGLAFALAGCGLRDLGTPVQAGSSPSTAEHSTASPPASLAEVPRAGEATLLRFADAFASLSVRAEVSRQRVLLALSAGALRIAVRRNAPHARLAAIRAMPADARIVGLASIRRLARASGTTAHGVVLISQRLEAPDGASELPLVEGYIATLHRARRGWRVTAFTPRR